MPIYNFEDLSIDSYNPLRHSGIMFCRQISALMYVQTIQQIYMRHNDST